MPEERWVPIPGVPGYDVSDRGRVRHAGSGCVRKLSRHRSGYLTVQLHIGSGRLRKTFSVHRLVMLTFCGSSERMVHHENSDRTDNRLCNLRYISASENSSHGTARGPTKSPCPVPVVDAEWRDIPDYPYQASSCGCIRRHPNKMVMGSQGKPLRPWASSVGYLMVSLCVGGRKRTHQIHSLVASAFHGLRPEGHVIDHLDGIKCNNAANNLQYVLPSVNALRFEKRLGKTRRGKTHARFTEDDVRVIKQRIQAGEPLTNIARDFGSPHNVISNIKTGRTWKEVA